jgi:predicted O-methyltransferase YrrM
MIISIVAELEDLILSLTGQSGRVGVSEQKVAMVYAQADWPQYTELVREAGRLLEQRGLIVSSNRGTHFRRF